VVARREFGTSCACFVTFSGPRAGGGRAARAGAVRGVAYAERVTTSTHLRGLVVDWGGVLTASLDSAMAQWAATDGVDFEHFRSVMRSWVGTRRAGGEDAAASVLTERAVADLEQAPDAGPAGTSPVHRLERGELPAREFEQALAEELARRGSPVEADGLLRRVLAGLEQLDPPMLDLVRRVHDAGIRTALLSNSWGDHYPEELWAGLFDAVVISGRVGMRKPDVRIFEHTAELLGLPPSACVMVDDLPHNVRGAVAAGMVAVRHSDYATTLTELEALFELDLG
jgi:epoxide hydrolase-like predicted phosphatase